jgi:hypothetical protein
VRRPVIGGPRDPHMFNWFTSHKGLECWFCRDKIDTFLKISYEDSSFRIFGVCKSHVDNFKDQPYEELSIEDIAVYEIMYI